MPEKPEVITVAKKLKTKLLNRKITKVQVLWPNIIEKISKEEFEQVLKGEEILDITTRGKWLVFHLTNVLLLIHLRMEGKFAFRNVDDPVTKHEHVLFDLDNLCQLRFADVRKFGKMRILPKDGYENQEPFTTLGYEAWDSNLTKEYLISKFKRKSLPIKSVLLDQTIIAGIGNIYADEILFLSHINPLKAASKLTENECDLIIKNTVKVLNKAIELGGTTIRSYTSEEGVTGLFQNNLYVHQREKELCRNCKSPIIKVFVNGRGTYYCPNCQK